MMADPVQTIQNIYTIYDAFKSRLDAMESSKEEFSRLSSRCQLIVDGLEDWKKGKASSKSTQILQNLESCFEDIHQFTSLPR